MRYSEDVHGFASSFVHGKIGSWVGSTIADLVGGGGGSRLTDEARKMAAAVAKTYAAGPPATSKRPRSSSCWQFTGTRWGWVCEAGETGTTLTQGPGTAGCTWPQRLDPRTGQCKIFVGTQSGPNGANGPVGEMGQAVAGAFGMPAIVPIAESRRHLSCPPGMVLGDDELCYPKAVLRRDSKFRKWRPGRRPVLTGGDLQAISKARRAITRGRDAVSSLGVTVKKKC